MPEAIDTSNWQYFSIGELFNVIYGVNLELVHLEATTPSDPDAIRFVSRTEHNNGVSAFVKKCPLYLPNPANTISVAGGGSVLATFLQTTEYYSGRDIYYLQPKQAVSNAVLLFITTLIRREKYRFNYGRQANKSLKALPIKLPAVGGVPDWQYMHTLIATHTHNYDYAVRPARNLPAPQLATADWQYYELGDLFTISYGNSFELINLVETKQSGVVYISRTEKNNGASATVAALPDIEPFAPGAITVAVSGSVLSTFLQTKPFYTGFHIMVLRPKEPLSKSALLFITTLIRREKYRFNYGRQANKSLKALKIRLPTVAGCPDWATMTAFMQTLPFSSQAIDTLIDQ